MIDSAKAYKFTHKEIIRIVLFIIVFGLFVAAVSAVMTKYFSPTNNPWVLHFILYQRFAIIAYFLFVILGAIIVPIPTLPADVIFLKLINPFIIIPVRLTADMIGSSIDFYMARKYGRPLLKRWFSAKNYTFIENLAENISWQQFFIVAMIPIINTELLAYAGGISKLRFRTVIWSLTLAVLYRLLFVYFVLKI